MERYLVMSRILELVNNHILYLLSRNGSPILVTLVSFWHFAIVRQQPLTPSVAFTSIMGM